MNSFVAEVKVIKSLEKLNIVEFSYGGEKLSMMSLQLDTKVQVGCLVQLGFKSLAVGIAKDLRGFLSYSNQLKCQIESIERGELLCEVKLLFCDVKIDSIITTASVDRMSLQKGDDITALIKASELYIEEVL